MQIPHDPFQRLLPAQLGGVFGLLGSGQFVRLATAPLEGLERARQPAELVGLAQERHLDVELPVSQLTHPIGDQRQRPADAARDPEGGGAGQDDDDEADGGVDPHDAEIDGIDVVDVDADADRPFPGGESQGVGQFGHQQLGAVVRAAGARIAISDVVAAALRRLDLALHRRHAVRIHCIQAILAL